MHYLIAMITAAAVWAYAVKYQLVLGYFGAVLIEQMPPPDQTSSKFYKYVYAVTQIFGANLRRFKDAVVVKKTDA